MLHVLYTHLDYLVFLLSLCVALDDVPALFLTVCCMTTLLLFDCMSCLSVWDTHLSPYLQLPRDDRLCFFCFYVCCLVEDLSLLAYLSIELVISRSISMFGSNLGVVDILMLIGVRYLKTCIDQS